MSNKFDINKHYTPRFKHKNDSIKNDVDDGVLGSEFTEFIRKDQQINPFLNFLSDSYIKKDAMKVYTKYKMYPFDKFNDNEIAEILKRHVVKVTQEIVVLNKPSGISVEDHSYKTKSINNVLSILASKLMIQDTLELVNRLDLDTTGILLLSRNPEMTFLLKDAFKRRLIRKNYLCLTVGEPKLKEGIIDFPIKEYVSNDRYVIKPDMKSVSKFHAKNRAFNKEIATGYRWIRSNYGISLLQCSTLSGVKHQVRCHLAYGLDVPILGDHKYASLLDDSRDKLLPQTLPKMALMALKIDQGKSRFIPLHLHCSTLTIGDPQLNKSRFDNKFPLSKKRQDKPLEKAHQLEILSPKLFNRQLDGTTFYAHLPEFFVNRMKCLKLYDLKTMKFLMKNIL